MSVATVITRGLGPMPAGPAWLITAGLGDFDEAPSPADPSLIGSSGAIGMAITGLTALARMIDILAANAAFDTVTVRLAKSPIALLPNVLPADFDEADYTGYAAGALDDATVAALLNPQGDLAAIFPHLTFAPTGTAVLNTIYAWWMQGVVGGAGAVVLAAGEFDPPVILTGPLTGIVLEPRCLFGQPLGN